MTWQPIETAPKDGTPVLTEYGVMAFYSIHTKYMEAQESGWALCHLDGNLHEENFGDLSVYHPTLWTRPPTTREAGD